MPKLNQKSYQDYRSWEWFQPFFPKENRLHNHNLPTEEYMPFDDMLIHVDRYIPSETKGEYKFVLVHGGGANGRLLSPMAIALRDMGYEAVSPDLPGFGLTTYNKVVEYQDWINVVLHLIEQEQLKDDKPIVLFGISLGGMLAYQVACLAKNIKGLIVTTLADTTQFKVTKVLAKNSIMASAGSKFMNGAPSITDGVKIPIRHTTVMSKMANNPDFVRLLIKDKVGSGSKVHLKWLRTLQTTKATIAPENFTKCPLLFLHPELDKLLSFEVSKPFYDKLACNKTLCYLEGCGHIPLEEPGISQMREYFLTFINNLD